MCTLCTPLCACAPGGPGGPRGAFWAALNRSGPFWTLWAVLNRSGLPEPPGHPHRHLESFFHILGNNRKYEDVARFFTSCLEAVSETWFRFFWWRAYVHAQLRALLGA